MQASKQANKETLSDTDGSRIHVHTRTYTYIHVYMNEIKR